MRILPSKTDFIEHAKRGNVYPVYAELPLRSPQEIYGSIKGPLSFLLESIKGPAKIARYSFAGADPFLVFRVKNGRAEISHGGQGPDRALPSLTRGMHPLRTLRELLDAYRTVPQEALPPFAGGAVCMIGYDFVRYLERLPENAVDDLQVPDAHFLFVDTVAACDHILKKTFIMSCPGASEAFIRPGSRGKDPLRDAVPDRSCLSVYYETACEKVNALYEKITSPGIREPGERMRENPRIRIQRNMGKNDYVRIVKKAKEYIRAGDIFQANLSQRVSAVIGGTDTLQIYRILSSINPSPFAAYLDMGDYHIVSSSPERLLKFSGGAAETRPIAGTRPRGTDEKSDREMRFDLLMNEKERAEHLMLIDLERNDLGKISDYGSVVVDELMITEDYSHVMHIVSNIKGTVARGKDRFDAIRAVFPGGTITGVPKIRCMEIIDELEPFARGPYTGSLGYISFAGSMDLNIIIRTFVVKNRTAYVQAGAGIVADSDPEREYLEALTKAEALMKTLQML